MSLRRTLILAAGFLLVCVTAQAVTIQLSPDADSWLDQNNSLHNFGGSPDLWNKAQPGDDRHCFYSFDLSSIPVGSTLTHATLHLYVSWTEEGASPVQVHRVTSDWTEATVNWANMGIDLDLATIHGTFVADVIGRVSCDITDLAQGWVDGSQDNQGLALIPTSNNLTSVYTSKECGDTSRRPYLEVEYTTPVPIEGMRVATGTYTGDGGTRTIHEAGFQPDLVIIKGDLDKYGVIRTSSMAGDLSKHLCGVNAARGDLIQSLDADGFTIGSDDSVNHTGTEFWWIAMKAAPGIMAVGSFTGNGAWGHPIDTVGFQPDYTIVFSEEAYNGFQRFSLMPSDWSVRFDNSSAVSDEILDETGAGFVVSHRNPVNGAGHQLHYACWKTAADNIQIGDYWGSGEPGSVTVGFEPDFALVKMSGGWSAAHRPQSLPGDATLSFRDLVTFSGGITGFTSTGFTHGADGRVSAEDEHFYWTAFRDLAPATADLEIAKEVDDTTPNEHDPIRYTLTLTNQGPADATDITVHDLLPTHLTYVGNIASHGSYTPEPGTWAIDSLANGAVATLEIDATVDEGAAGKTITNTASINGLQQEDQLDANDLASVDIVVRENFRMATGSYVGDGSVSRGIEVGEFEPGFVLVKGDHDLPAVFTTPSMPSQMSKELGVTTAIAANRIRGLNNDGFHVGSDPTVNAQDVTFYWTAIEVGMGRIVTDSYVGNGQDDRSIDWVGFEPSYVIVASEQDRHAMERFADQPVDASFEFEHDTAKGNRIQDFEPTGFQVGNHDTVNKSDESYHFVAFRDAPGRIATGTYSGDGSDDRPIPDAGFEPLSVVLKIDDGKSGVFKTDNMTGDQTLPLDDTGPAFIDGIQGLLPDGFEVGPDDRVNKDTKDIYWFAIWGDETAGADLEVTKSVDNPTPNELEQIKFTIQVANLGPSTATGVGVLDLLDGNLSYASHETLSGTYTPGTGSWLVGDLGYTESAILEITATVPVGTGGLTIPNEASVTTLDQTDPNGTNDQDRVEIVVQSADLAVAKFVDDPTPNEGETIEFSVSLSNLGPDAASAVQLSDLLPSGVTYDGHDANQGIYNSGSGLWQVGTLAPDSVATLSLMAVVDPGTGGDTIVNSASVLSADQADPNDLNNVDTAGIQVQSADLALAMALDDPFPNEGDTVRFIVTLTNVGPDTATTVLATDLLPAGLVHEAHEASQGTYSAVDGLWSVGTIADGAVVMLNLDATVASETGGETIVNEACITAADQADPVGTNNCETVELTVQSADLFVVKTVDNASPSEGEMITYTVTLSNDGPDGTTGVELVDELPEGLTYSSHIANTGTYSSLTGLWEVGPIPNGESAELSLSATVDAGTGGSTITNTATITAADQADPNPWNNSSSSDIGSESADLGITKSVDDPRPNVGETVVFTLVLSNAGASNATGVVVTDPIPTGLLYVSHTASVGTYVDETGMWSLDGLPLGEEATLGLTATVAAGTGGKTITNTASIDDADQADPNGSNNIATAAIIVASADLAVSKVVDDAAARPGETVTFTIGVTNLGPDRATGIQILDQLPAGLTYQSSEAQQGSYSTTTGLWVVGSLDHGAQVTLEIAATVDEGDLGSSLLRNTAAVDQCDQTDLHPNNDSAWAEITLIEAILVSALPQQSTPLLPGAEDVDVFGLRLTNGSSTGEQLTALSVHNATSGPGTEEQLDGDWSPLSLSAQPVGSPQRETVGSASFIDGTATFEDLSVLLVAGESCDLFIEGGASLSARDSDACDLIVTDAEQLVFSRSLFLEGTWPLDPAGSFPIDGLVAEQITSHAVVPGPVQVGEVDRLVLDLTVPANGYESDILNQVRLVNEGDAAAVTDLSTVRLWRDGGNGSFDAGATDDTALGSLGWDGSYWTLAGLSEPVPPAGIRLFITADIDAGAVPGRTIRFGLPAAPFDGLIFASDNDGPLDQAILEAGTMTIVADPGVVLRISASPQEEVPLRPADEAVTLLEFRIENRSAVAETLETLQIENTTEGPGTPAQLDGGLSTLMLIEQTPGKELWTLATTSFSDGFATFSGLASAVAPGTTATYLVRGGASLDARDGDRIDLRIPESTSFTFAGSLPIEGEWPIDPVGSFPVDGMVAEQIVLHPIPAGSVYSGETDLLVLDIEVPANGYDSDILEEVHLELLGDAEFETEIEAIRLWADRGNGHFDAGAEDDSLLGTGEAADTVCVWTDLAEAIPVEGRRLFVSTDLMGSAREGRSLRFGLPSDPDEGFVVASANDGPLDGPLQNPEPLTILEPSEDGLNITAQQPGAENVLPGSEPFEVYRIRLANYTDRAEQLLSITLDNATEGTGDMGDLDRDWSAIDLFLLEQGHTTLEGLTPLASAQMQEGSVRFAGLSIDLPIRDEVTLAFAAAASLVARDGDRLDLLLADHTGLDFGRSVPSATEWPLDPAGSYTVDGMAADQITLHPVETGAVPAGAHRNLVFDVVLPANGYEIDELNRLNLVNLGTAENGIDLDLVEAWLDDGDGLFEPGNDRLFGSMRFTGNRWEITALSETVPLEGLRIFVSVDVNPLAVGGRTIRFALPGQPDVGVGMASDNDGPLDRQVANPVTQVISSVDRVTMTAQTVASGIVHPGDRDVLLLHLIATNTHEDNRTVTGLAFENRSTGWGATADLDAAFEVLLLREDGNANGEFDDALTDPVAGTATFTGGHAQFRGLEWRLEPGRPRHMFLTTHVSLRNTTDGDILATRIANGFEIEFAEPAGIAGDWPIDSGARWIADGMVARQVGNLATGVATLGPGGGPALALDLVVPANGYLEDTLQGLRIVNLGTAGPAEIDELRLWRDGGNGSFEGQTGDDVDLGALLRTDEEWASAFLSEPLGLGGGRFYLSLRVSESLGDSASVRLAVPIDGLAVASENDGPIDERIASPDGILLSSACLLTTLESDPSLATVGQEITVRMQVQNRSEDSVESVAPISLEQGAAENLTLISGPEPATLRLEPGAVGSFEWTFVGTSPGEARLTGAAEGIGVESGTPCASLGSTSSTLRILREARTLQMFAVRSLPFTVNRGQAGVVPLSLTFRNTGGDEGSNINVTGIRFRLENQNGETIEPIDLLTRVLVNEGNRVYLDQPIVAPNPNGEIVDLTLASPVLVTTFEPVTLNLQFDLSPETLVSDFRVVVLESDWFDAEDATDRAPVGVDLLETTFPIRSGLARIVAEATSVAVSPTQTEPIRVSPGQEDVELLRVELENVGLSGITSDARVGLLALSIIDPAGQPIPDPGELLERLHVRSSVLGLADPAISGTTGEGIQISLNHPLNLPVNTSISLAITGDLPDSARIESFRLRLEEPSSFQIWDANTRNPVEPTYETTPIEGGLVSIEEPATSIVAYGTPSFPSALSVGARSVKALDLAFVHPGGPGTARIQLDGFRIECWNKAHVAIPAGVYLDRVRIVAAGEDLADLFEVDPSAGAIWVGFDELLIEPGGQLTAELIIDVRADAPESFLEIAIRGSEIVARDANSGHSVDAVPQAGSLLPLFSGMTHLRSPARELLVAMESRMPAALVADGRESPVATLNLLNPATDGAGSIRVDHLRIRAGDAEGNELPIGAVATSVVLYDQGERWAESALLSPDSTTAWIAFPQPLVLEAGDLTALDARILFRERPQAETVRFSWSEEDFGILQPEGAAFSVQTRPMKGFSLPFWTESGTFSIASLRESFANFPNPFAAGREETHFVFYLPKPASITLQIFTTRGDRVVTVTDAQEHGAGLQQALRWDGRNGRGAAVRNGLYIAELNARFSDGSRKRLLRKVAVVR